MGHGFNSVIISSVSLRNQKLSVTSCAKSKHVEFYAQRLVFCMKFHESAANDIDWVAPVIRIVTIKDFFVLGHQDHFARGTSRVNSNVNVERVTRF